MEQQDRQDRARLATRDVDRAALAMYLERAKDLEVHLCVE
jgi:uncharacterized membrane protein